jgi:DNA-binding GntR family transcriptional regulator
MAMNLREEARHHRADDGIVRHQAILAALESNDARTVLTALEDHGHLHYLGLEKNLENGGETVLGQDR